jgi:hypothetical protein
MQKIDYKKEYKTLYTPSTKTVSLVQVPEMNFLKLDGEGDPNTAVSYHLAIEALYSVSYTLKFMVKQGPMAIDYGVMPLEGLWWSQNMATFMEDKSTWQWTMIIMQPEFITPDLIQEAIQQAQKKKENPMLSQLRFESYNEGKAAQIMHIGTFDSEGPTVAKVHAFIEASGCQISGLHHEIYLSDPRRTAPEKWKTIIRQPMV